MRIIPVICLIVLNCCVSYSQTAEPTFEVASVKPAPPLDPGKPVTVRMGAGGPGSKDPGRIDWANVTLMNLLVFAYDIKTYQVSGPAWLTSARFDVTATIAKDATREQFLRMLQNLLADRFQLKLHHEQRESVMYSLLVAKGGPKMKQSPEEPPPAEGAAPSAPPPPNKMQKDEDGFPLFPGLRGAYISGNGGRMRMRASQQTMSRFAIMLTGQLGHPVIDATGLTGKYDFVLTYAPGGIAANSSDADADPDIFGAMQQIGLKLEPKKGMIDTLVIDHAEKVPTGN